MARLAGTEDQRTFAPQQHARLQAYSPILDHLRGVLTSQYFTRIEDLRAARTTWFSYSGQDVYRHDEPVQIEIAAVSELDKDLLPEVKATLTVTDRPAGSPVLERSLRVRREARSVDLGLMEPGTYEIDIKGRSDAASVSDVFIVAEPAS